MRVMRDYRDGPVMQSYLHAAQYSSSSLTTRAREAWNQWEIQFLVVASFSLQVFLLLSAPFRKRHRSRVLNGSIWLTYLLADYVATYILGRLTLLLAIAGDDPQHQLSLFWAPFLLLHLGGQETITAFSMEDNTLWKRRQLDLAAQVATAVYVVAKQWQGDKLLVAPMVLMFISGAVKYGERIWALRAAAARSPGSSSFPNLVNASFPRRNVMRCYDRLISISSEDKISLERIMEEASIEFPASLDFFMDVTPSSLIDITRYDYIKDGLLVFKSSKNGDGVAYKLAEMQVSLIHDYLYTKFGTIRFQAPKSSPATGGALQWLSALGLTSVALALLAMAMAHSTSNNYSRADVLISYTLLVGAIVMEISSIFNAFVTSYWAGTSVAKHLHLQVGEWSGKLAQYNMIDACIQERKRQAAAGIVGAAIRRVLPSSETTQHIVISPEVKKLLVNKVLEIATDLRSHNWDFSRFQGQWALWVANKVNGDHDPTGPAHEALSTSKIQEMNFVPNVVVWHLVTSMCLLDGNDPGELTNPCKELSNYIMYLVAKRKVMVDSDGHMVISMSREAVQRFYLYLVRQQGIVEGGVPDFLREGHTGGEVISVHQEAPTIARRVCVELLRIPEARDRWELIAAVWTEILCYMALNCGAAFHAKHLTTSGEFITQAKMLLFIIRLPFLRNSLEPILS